MELLPRESRARCPLRKLAQTTIIETLAILEAAFNDAWDVVRWWRPVGDSNPCYRRQRPKVHLF